MALMNELYPIKNLNFTINNLYSLNKSFFFFYEEHKTFKLYNNVSTYFHSLFIIIKWPYKMECSVVKWFVVE